MYCNFKQYAVHMQAVACLSAFVAVIFLQFIHNTEELLGIKEKQK